MTTFLGNDSVLKKVLHFSLPYLLSYFLQTLYGMADLLIIGRFDGVAATTAVSIGSQVMHMSTVMLVRVPGAYLASKFFPQTLLPMGLASACGSLFSILVCVIAYHWLKRQQKAVLHG